MNEPDREGRIPPVRKSIEVNLGLEDAFRRFTTEIDSWWPLRSHAVTPASATKCVFESGTGGELFEQHEDGTKTLWGVVRLWNPPQRVVFSWHPGRDPDSAQEVDVRFSPTRGGTRVTLEHRGWERLRDAAEETRDEYDGGWDGVLRCYVEQNVSAHQAD